MTELNNPIKQLEAILHDLNSKVTVLEESLEPLMGRTTLTEHEQVTWDTINEQICEYERNASRIEHAIYYLKQCFDR